MALKFPAGTKVRQIVKPLVGVADRPVIIDNDVQYMVKWTDEAGDEHERQFREDEIEAVPEEAPAGDAPAA